MKAAASIPFDYAIECWETGCCGLPITKTFFDKALNI